MSVFFHRIERTSNYYSHFPPLLTASVSVASSETSVFYFHFPPLQDSVLYLLWHPHFQRATPCSSPHFQSILCLRPHARQVLSHAKPDWDLPFVPPVGPSSFSSSVKVIQFSVLFPFKGDTGDRRKSALGFEPAQKFEILLSQPSCFSCHPVAPDEHFQGHW
jgi:hypothetical protein